MSSSDSPNPNGVTFVKGTDSDVLILSMRRLNKLVAYALQYEFEDVFTDLTGADRVEPSDMAALERSRCAYKLTRMATGSRRLARSLAPAPVTVPLQRDYELFLAVFNNVWELYALATVPNWRSRCRHAACFINEVWLEHMPGYLLELLADFDHVFVGSDGPASEFARVLDTPVSYLPLSVDVLRFAPNPVSMPHPIYVSNIGRRSPVTHAALLEHTRSQGLFYYYDTVAASGADLKQRTFQIDNHREHRELLASILQRSRYFIANRGLVNQSVGTSGGDIIPNRIYEGAAAGVVMLGAPPRSKEFKRQFDWPGAVIEIPFDYPDVGRALAELDLDPCRLERIHCDNIRNAALRHDVVYRIRTIFEILGLQPTAGMHAREAQLREVANGAAALGDSLRVADEMLANIYAIS
jgi:hypothetical protein